MANFPDFKPVFSAAKRSAPAVRTVKFGDGYEQRLSYGLNQNPKEWTLSFNLSNSDAEIVENFLDARSADLQSFGWTPPDSTTSYRWKCPSWTKEMFDFDRSRIEVTFIQVFEP